MRGRPEQEELHQPNDPSAHATLSVCLAQDCPLVSLPLHSWHTGSVRAVQGPPLGTMFHIEPALSHEHPTAGRSPVTGHGRGKRGQVTGVDLMGIENSQR